MFLCFQVALLKKFTINTKSKFQISKLDADSTALFFIFICKLSSSVDEKSARNIIFEVFTKSKLLNRLYLFDDFWDQFNVQNKNLEKASWFGWNRKHQ